VAVIDARRWATGLNAVLVAILVVAAAIVASELARTHAAELDLSADRAGSLGEDTRAALALLDQRDLTVRITAFTAQAKDDEAWLRDRMMRDFLDTLRQASPRVEAELVDFDRDRLTAERLGVDRYGTVVVQVRNDRVDLSDRDVFHAKGPKGKRDVRFVGESAVAAAVRKLVSGGSATIYLTTGHGERAIWDRGLGELKALASRIDDQGFTARTLDLLGDAPPGGPQVPADAAAVLIVGPRAPFSAPEESALRAYLGGGGSVGVFVDPGGTPPALLEDLGVELGAGVVLDPTAFLPDLDRPLLRYGRHEITRPLAEDDVATVVATAAPVLVQPRDGVTSDVLLQTSRQGWVERGTERPPTFTAGEDASGPAVVGVALVVGKPVPWIARDNARIAVVGDVDLLRDELLDEGPGNGTFVTNTLRWLARSDQPLAPVGRSTAARRLELGESQLAVVRWTLVVGVPSLVLVAGALVMRARRAS
jgi:hypothetical protein